MIDLLLAAMLLQGAADPCMAADAAAGAPNCPAWRSVYTQGDAEVFADPAAERRDGNVVEVRARTVFRAAREHGVRSVISRDRYDCVARTVAIVHFQAFDAEGRTLVDMPIPAAQAAPTAPLPGSPNAALLARFCPAPAAS
jgi:hypothetical protein